jgi:flagellar protein FlgJ
MTINAITNGLLPAQDYVPFAGSRNSAGDFPALLQEGLLKEGILKKAEAVGRNKPTHTTHSNGVHIDKSDKLYQQCEALETFLVKNVLSSMRKTVQKSGFMKQDFAGDMYEDMLYDKYAESLTKNADFCLAELAYLELTGQRGKVINQET